MTDAEQVRILREAREYVYTAATRYYDGTNGETQRRTAGELLGRIDAALAATANCKGTPRPCDCAAATALAGVSDPAAFVASWHEMLDGLEQAAIALEGTPLKGILARARAAAGPVKP